MMWNETYGDIGSLAHSVVKTQDGGYAFAGVVNKLDAWIVKTDANGNMDWNLTFEGSSIETFCNLMVQASDGGYAIVGTKGGKIWFAKVAALSQPFPPITHLVIVILTITIGLTIAGYILNKYTRRKRITTVS